MAKHAPGASVLLKLAPRLGESACSRPCPCSGEGAARSPVAQRLLLKMRGWGPGGAEQSACRVRAGPAEARYAVAATGAQAVARAVAGGDRMTGHQHHRGRVEGKGGWTPSLLSSLVRLVRVLRTWILVLSSSMKTWKFIIPWIHLCFTAQKMLGSMSLCQAG